MRPAVRISLVVVGLAAAVYGTASLTGGWLGTPPWWHRPNTTEAYGRLPVEHFLLWGTGTQPGDAERWASASAPYPDRPSVGVALTIVGVALVSYGAWPGRRRATAAA